MSCPFKDISNLNRRSFFKMLGGAGLVAVGAGIGVGAVPLLRKIQGENGTLSARDRNSAISFYGDKQAGILIDQQDHNYFAAFDVTTSSRESLAALMQRWTLAAANLTQGKPAGDHDALGLNPARLTITFGFGPGLFDKRFGLAGKKPESLADLPKFNGDQLIAEKSGGDISIQACADDPQVAFHAVRQLTRIAGKDAHLRWAQTGFLSRPEVGHARNLQGFHDSIRNPKGDDVDKYVWVKDGPEWLRGGSYLIARRIRIALEHWDNSDVDFQEQVIGRSKISGAPLSGKDVDDDLDLKAVDQDGNFIIAENAHVRLGSALSNGGEQILRRGYSYNDGVNFTAERWPPWRQGMEYDAGLFFLAYQRDPGAGFIRIYDKMSKLDALNQFTTHTSSAMFAVPLGVREGEFIGQALLA